MINIYIYRYSHIHFFLATNCLLLFSFEGNLFTIETPSAIMVFARSTGQGISQALYWCCLAASAEQVHRHFPEGAECNGLSLLHILAEQRGARHGQRWRCILVLWRAVSLFLCQRILSFVPSHVFPFVQVQGLSFQAWLCGARFRWRCGLIGALASMESLCLRSGRWMSFEACSDMKRNYLVLRTSLNLLARRAFDKKVLRYHIRPKLHYMGHLIYHYLPRNPRHMACYLDEDFISRTKRLAERCHPLYMSQQVTFRYAVHMCLKLSGKLGE